MSVFDSIVYGILQGLTEFLPVSSSGHLALLPKLLKISDPGILFDLSMHVGTALAVLIYFYKDCLYLIKERGSAFSKNFWIATVATCLFALIVKGFAEEFGRNPMLIGFNLALFGIFLGLADHFGKEDQDLIEKVQVKSSLIIGLMQVLALFPGVSRSGITITAARVLGVDRVKASRFSFLLSLPLIGGGFLLKLKEGYESGIAFEFSECFLGLLVSFVVGLLTIHFFLKLISRIGLWYFSVYRLILAALIFYYAI